MRYISLAGNMLPRGWLGIDRRVDNINFMHVTAVEILLAFADWLEEAMWL